MTPLEELRAAHRQLSELRDKSKWESLPVTSINVSGSSSYSRELDYMLRRTIDAQLRLLSDAQYLVQQGFGQQSVLALARAINGGTDDPA
jgi:hypothetical protein